MSYVTRTLGRVRVSGLAVLDQYVYSLGNLIPSIAVARATGPEGFAAFSAVFLMYGLVLGLSRAAFAEPLVMTYRTRIERQDVLRRLQCWMAIVSLGMLFVLVAAWGAIAGFGWSIGRSESWPFLFIIALPFHLLHDAARLVLIADRRSVRPLLSDLLWLSVAALTLFVSTSSDPIFNVAIVWLAGGVVAAVYVVPPMWHSSNGAPLWLPRLGAASAAEYAMQPAVVQVTQLLAGGVGSAAALAGLRGGAVAFRPLQLALMAHRSLSIGAANSSISRRGVARSGLLIAALGSSAYGLILAVSPSAVGEMLLGGTWPLVRSVLVPITLAQIASLCGFALVTEVKRRVAIRTLVRLRVVGVVSIPSATVVGVLLGDLAGGAWGMLVGQIVGLAWMIWMFSRRP